MAFKDNLRLDRRMMQFGSSAGDAFATIIATSESGDESRDATRERDQGEWLIIIPPKRVSELKDFKAFFKVANGRANTWRLVDPEDYLVGTGEGVVTQLTSTTFQMWKRWSYAGYTFDNKVVLPVDVTIAGGGSYSVGSTTGIITVASGANPSGWTGKRDKLVRFDTDKLDRTITDKNTEIIIKLAPVPIKEVRG
jgi:uncharacterized protein (TIGR02217 family)